MDNKKDCRQMVGQHRQRASSLSMSNRLSSSEEMKHHDNCKGIHGAARARKGVKSATRKLSRRLSKMEISKWNY
jgi:hypothetical protein